MHTEQKMLPFAHASHALISFLCLQVLRLKHLRECLCFPLHQPFGFDGNHLRKNIVDLICRGTSGVFVSHIKMNRILPFLFNQSAYFPLTPGIIRALSSEQQQLTGYFLSLEPFSGNALQYQDVFSLTVPHNRTVLIWAFDRASSVAAPPEWNA